MPSVCFYFQMHQPLRLRRYSVFDTDPHYFDEALNLTVLRKVVEKCYEPATERLLGLIRRHEGRFRVSLGISGILLDQLREHAAPVLDALVGLAETGFVEFVNEPYHHSLAFLYSRDEFRDQTDLHAAAVADLFGQTPRVFRNTELIYNNDLAHFLESLGRYDGVMTEGADRVLDGRSANQLYRPPHCDRLGLLLRNYELSDDIAFRFSNRDWPGYPLTAEKFARSVARIDEEDGRLCNVFIDFETFGEHQWAETGIFTFLDELPAAVLRHAGARFRTLSEALDTLEPADRIDVPNMISWADTERDLSAWLGNAMQSNAAHELYKLEAPIKQRGDQKLLEDWRRLTVSDHFYYMCTKYFADAAVHSYFNPYESPYDSYINFMNVLDNLRTRVGI